MNYRIKKLIKGYRIKPSLKDKTLIAVPFKYKGNNIEISFNNKKMIIKKDSSLLHFQSFKDKFGRNKQYTLYYYEWIEKDNQTALW